VFLGVLGVDSYCLAFDVCLASTTLRVTCKNRRLWLYLVIGPLIVMFLWESMS
jgi:hypothetical protein